MAIFNHLEELQTDMTNKNVDEVEEKYYHLCSYLAGIEQANEIKKVNLANYVNALKIKLEKALAIAKREAAKAIYFEYDLDNNWESSFFICGNYSPVEDFDEEWAADWLEDFEGPSLESFSDMYLENGFDSSDAAIGSTMYLVARTVVSYAKALRELTSASPIPICIAFHDQEPIMRVE